MGVVTFGRSYLIVLSFSEKARVIIIRNARSFPAFKIVSLPLLKYFLKYYNTALREEMYLFPDVTGVSRDPP
jgi:hypothetical protein